MVRSSYQLVSQLEWNKYELVFSTRLSTHGTYREENIELIAADWLLPSTIIRQLFGSDRQRQRRTD